MKNYRRPCWLVVSNDFPAFWGDDHNWLICFKEGWTTIEHGFQYQIRRTPVNCPLARFCVVRHCHPARQKSGSSHPVGEWALRLTLHWCHSLWLSLVHPIMMVASYVFDLFVYQHVLADIWKLIKIVGPCMRNYKYRCLVKSYVGSYHPMVGKQIFPTLKRWIFPSLWHCLLGFHTKLLFTRILLYDKPPTASAHTKYGDGSAFFPKKSTSWMVNPSWMVDRGVIGELGC